MKLQKVLFLVILCVLFISASSAYVAIADNSSFSRNLKVGDFGKDVKNLQIFLNSDTNTAVALSGVGSKGNETEYFGNATAKALSKFQEMYSSEILIPNGLVKGTGFLGGSTRAKINAILAKSRISGATVAVAPPVSLSNTQHPTPNTSDKTIAITGVSPLYGPVGTMVSVSGMGFLPTGNMILLNNSLKVENVSLSNGNLSFKVPNSFPTGIYGLTVSNTNGVSENDNLFIITSGKNKSPKIDSVSPNSISAGDEITIKGSGFSNYDNLVMTSYGNVKNISSTDGNVIKLRLIPQVGDKVIANDSGKSFSLPVYFYIINENGINSSPGLVNVNY